MRESADEQRNVDPQVRGSRPLGHPNSPRETARQDTTGSAGTDTDRVRIVSSAEHSDVTEPLTAEALAQRFHEAYERLAPRYSYKTRRESAVPWADVPRQNKALMIAVAGEILAYLDTARDAIP